MLSREGFGGGLVGLQCISRSDLLVMELVNKRELRKLEQEIVTQNIMQAFNIISRPQEAKHIQLTSFPTILMSRKTLTNEVMKAARAATADLCANIWDLENLLRMTGRRKAPVKSVVRYNDESCDTQ